MPRVHLLPALNRILLTDQSVCIVVTILWSCEISFNRSAICTTISPSRPFYASNDSVFTRSFTFQIETRPTWTWSPNHEGYTVPPHVESQAIIQNIPNMHALTGYWTLFAGLSGYANHYTSFVTASVSKARSLASIPVIKPTWNDRTNVYHGTYIILKDYLFSSTSHICMTQGRWHSWPSKPHVRWLFVAIPSHSFHIVLTEDLLSLFDG